MKTESLYNLINMISKFRPSITLFQDDVNIEAFIDTFKEKDYKTLYESIKWLCLHEVNDFKINIATILAEYNSRFVKIIKYEQPVCNLSLEQKKHFCDLARAPYRTQKEAKC